MTRLGIDQADDVFRRLVGHGILGLDSARFQHAGENDAGDARALFAAPATIFRLGSFQVADSLVNRLFPLLRFRTDFLGRFGRLRTQHDD